jgi:hypothetical protein
VKKQTNQAIFLIETGRKFVSLKILQYGYHLKALGAGHLKMMFYLKSQTGSDAHSKFDANV